jgi:hypothetical protein
MAKQKFEPAPMNIECVDIWPPGTLGRPEMLAYKEAESAERIKVKKIRINQVSGRATVRYLSTIPHEWMVGELREHKRAIVARGEQMSLEGMMS